MTNEFTCQEMTEVVTTYLDEAMPAEDQERYERHISYCAGCRTYLGQMRATIRQTGMVPRQESLPPALRERILDQFRTWRRN